MTKQIRNLIDLLQNKDNKLNLYTKNEKFMKFIEKSSINKFVKSKLQLILLRKINFHNERNKNALLEFFLFWKLKSLFVPKLKPNNVVGAVNKISTVEKKSEISFLIQKQIAKKMINSFEDFNFSLISLAKNPKYIYLGINIYNILSKRIYKIIFSFAFNQLLKCAHFNIIKSKMILFKNILLNKKLKFILKLKHLKDLKIHFDKLKPKQNVTLLIPNSKSKSSDILLAKIILSNLNKKSISYFYKWLNETLKSKSNQQNELLNAYKSIEDEFQSKLSEIEQTYTTNIEKVLNRNKELESKVIQSNKEIEKYKYTEEIQNRNIEELSEIIEQNKNDDAMIDVKNKINILHEKYENELRRLREENESLKEANNEYNKEFEKRKNEKSHLEKKILNMSSVNEKITSELTECLKKYENLKNLSNQTTEEMIKTNNEISKLKAENKSISVTKLNLIETIEKLTNEVNSKERTIRQLRLNEDTLNIQFQSERDKLDNKLLNEKNNSNGKIELLDKEKESLKDQIKNLNKENKNVNEKLKTFNDYNLIKKEVIHLRDKIVSFDNENSSVKLQNINLQKQIEKLIENIANESKRYENTKLELEELRALSKDSKEDLRKALEEMEGYGNLLVAFESKIKEAEMAKAKAEKERDEAVEDVKKIRQRYINILDNKSLESNL